MSEQSPGRELLGAISSFDYGDCSNAAQALEYRAGTLMRHAMQVLSLHETSGIGEPRDTHALAYELPSSGAQNAPIELDLGEGLTPARLLLVSEDLSGAPRLSRAKEQALGRLTTRYRQYERHKGDGPARLGARSASHSKLILLLEDTVAVPLAQFRKTEEAGACGYVQIGRGLSDAELHAVPADDTEPTFAQVEAIKALLDGELPANADHMSVIKALARDRIREDGAEIDRALEKALIEKVFKHFRDNRKKERLVLAHRSGEGYASEATTATWAEELLLTSGQRVEVKLVHETAASNGELQLCAVVRNDVAIPLARFNQRHGNVELAPDYAKVCSKQDFIRGMFRQNKVDLRAGTYLHYVDDGYNLVVQEIYDSSDREKKDRVLRGVTAKKLWVDTGKYTVHTQADQTAVNRAFAQPDLYTFNYSLGRNGTNLGFQGLWLENKKEYYRVLSAKYKALPGLVDTVQAFTGVTTPHYEHLIDRLHWMLDGKQKAQLGGVAKDIKSGKTSIDQDITFEVQRHDNSYAVRVWAKPQARDKEAPVIVAEGLYDPTAPAPNDHKTAIVILDILDLIEA